VITAPKVCGGINPIFVNGFYIFKSIWEMEMNVYWKFGMG